MLIHALLQTDPVFVCSASQSSPGIERVIYGVIAVHFHQFFPCKAIFDIARLVNLILLHFIFISGLPIKLHNLVVVD